MSDEFTVDDAAGCSFLGTRYGQRWFEDGTARAFTCLLERGEDEPGGPWRGSGLTVETRAWRGEPEDDRELEVSGSVSGSGSGSLSLITEKS